ncbi:DUF2059 domain-containing protein [Novosphingobium sp. JCM 18896]|uniref:DUF2059 domain-containing protein n=1 Tax=Novosphingobium sp. JCM 18896 TaxID=2989731 RepID=UPI00222212E2|nr:DUF2059 domain-containing protein [Novosphingobium sp. JCM 18896]MCW1428282.1 DUF2059 domain-containing protein [Novosphingobium sp. JCM 18896]
MMKFACALALAPALLLSAPAWAEPVATTDPAAIAHAREIVETIMPPDRRSTMVADMMRTLTDQMRPTMLEQSGDPALRRIIDSHLAKVLDRLTPVTERYMPRLIDAMAEAYTHEFSPAELDEVARFARTPAGRRYLSRSTAIMADPAVAAANRTYFVEAQEASLSSQTELQSAIAGYLLKHPDASRKIMQGAKAPAAQP